MHVSDVLHACLKHDDKLILRYGRLTKDIYTYVQPRLLAEVLTIANL